MENETLFYICGAVLAVSAVVLTFAGLKLKNFPGRALPVIVLWFVVFVAAAGTFSVLQAKDHEAHNAHELEAAGEKIEEAESGGFGNEGGALGGETEEGEEEAEEAAEGSVEEEEPVGETEGSKEGKKGAEGREGSGGGAKASATTLELAADPAAIAFDKTELTAKPGKVTIDFDNPSAIPHNVVIEADGKELAGFEPIAESQKSVSADLEAGTYTFLCTVPGHAAAGMEGTLTVK